MKEQNAAGITGQVDAGVRRIADLEKQIRILTDERNCYEDFLKLLVKDFDGVDMGIFREIAKNALAIGKLKKMKQSV